MDRKLADKISLVGKFVAQCQVDIDALLDDIMKTHELVMVMYIFVFLLNRNDCHYLILEPVFLISRIINLLIQMPILLKYVWLLKR